MEQRLFTHALRGAAAAMLALSLIAPAHAQQQPFGPFGGPPAPGAPQQGGQAQPQGGGMQPSPKRRVDPREILAPAGARVEAVATGLTYVTSLAFGSGGELYVGEAGGHTYGTTPAEAPPSRILVVQPDGNLRVVFDHNVPVQAIRAARNPAEIPEGLISPITGLTWHNGLLYVAHRTRVSTLNPRTGEFRTIVNGLPAWGEFQNNKAIFGPDGKMYFFVSTQGNSGPVGDHMLKVLTFYDKPLQSEVPCEDVVLTGENYSWPNPFTNDPNDKEVYGVYVPYGVFTPPGTVIQGQIPCNGAFFRANPDGSNLELVAWGLRSNFGYRFTRDGRLITTMNSGNPIPPREIFDDWETIWEVQPGAWYGWPDYYSGLPVIAPRFQRPNEPGTEQFQPLDFVLTQETRRRLLRGRTEPIQPLMRIEPHVALEGFVFGRPEFGIPADEMIAAEFGTVVTYLRQEDPGFRVVRINPFKGTVTNFLVNITGKPASATGGGGLERPIQLEWGPDGALYVADFGVINVTDSGLNAEPNTGVVWKVTLPPAPAAAPPPAGGHQPPTAAPPARPFPQRAQPSPQPAQPSPGGPAPFERQQPFGPEVQRPIPQPGPQGPFEEQPFFEQEPFRRRTFELEQPGAPEPAGAPLGGQMQGQGIQQPGGQVQQPLGPFAQQPPRAQAPRGQPPRAGERGDAAVGALVDLITANFPILEQARASQQLVNQLVQSGQPPRVVMLRQALPRAAVDEFQDLLRRSTYLQRNAELARAVVRNNQVLLQALQQQGVSPDQVVALGLATNPATIFVLTGSGGGMQGGTSGPPSRPLQPFGS